MTATNYALLTTRIQTECDDPAAGQFVGSETPQGTRDGVNVLFRLANPNVIAGSLFYTYGTSIRQTTGFTLVDASSGYLQIGSAPDNGTTFPFYFDYKFTWFLQADYNGFIDQATEELGYAAGTATPEGLYPALVQYCADKFWTRRSSIYAIRHSSSAGGASEAVQTVAQAFLNIAKSARKKGDTLRDDYYKRFGQRNQPSSWTITHGVTSYVPRR